MAKCNDMLESHSAKEKFPQSDKLSAKNSPHWSPSGFHHGVESENHRIQPNPPYPTQNPKKHPIEHSCAQRLWPHPLARAIAVAKAMGLIVHNGDFPQTMRQ